MLIRLIRVSGIRPLSSAHTGSSSVQHPTLSSRSGIRSFTWSGLGTSTWTDQLRDDSGFVPANVWRSRPNCMAMVERRDGPSWLRDVVSTYYTEYCVLIRNKRL